MDISILWDMYLTGELLGHVDTACLTFADTAKPFSEVVVLSHQHYWQWFLHSLSDTYIEIYIPKYFRMMVIRYRSNDIIYNK